MLADIQACHPQVFRFTIFWSQVARSARPLARNPDDSAYNWTEVDPWHEQISASRDPVALHARLDARVGRRRLEGAEGAEADVDLQNFAYAAAARYNGKHADASGTTLPKVVRWEAWNEPNLQTHLMPQWTAVGTKRQVGRPYCFGKSWVPASPGIYRGILNAIYKGVHAAGQVRQADRAGRGGGDGSVRPRPVRRRPGLRAARVPARSRREAGFARRLVASSLSQRPPELQAVRGDNVDVQGMPRLYAALTKAFHGRKVPVWVTEFGAQTKPPDTRQGVSLSQQAAQLRQAVSAFKKLGPRQAHGLVPGARRGHRGSAYAAGFQSGLEFFNGKRKPAFDGLPLPGHALRVARRNARDVPSRAGAVLGRHVTHTLPVA